MASTTLHNPACKPACPAVQPCVPRRAAVRVSCAPPSHRQALLVTMLPTCTAYLDEDDDDDDDDVEAQVRVLSI